MLKMYYQNSMFKTEDDVREWVDTITDIALSSIDGLSIDFLRQFKDRIDFDIIFHAPYNNYHKNKKIMKEFYRVAEEKFHITINN